MNIDHAENRQALLHELRLLRQRVYELEWQAAEKRRLEKALNSALFERDSLREAARERKTLAMQLHQSAKLQAIGELAGGIAHDFNNQLGGIAGYANLLRDKLKHDDQLLPLVEGVLDATRRSADLTSKLLAFARKEDNLQKSVDMHAIICDVIVLLGHSIDKRIGIETRLMADYYTIIGDPTQLYNMLLNIALNARDAMPHGGKLTFSTENACMGTDNRKLSRVPTSSGEYLRICVSDTGSGMVLDTQRRIFEPFFTTKKSGEGTGMGLTIVKRTIKQHNGAINVESYVDVGTTFTLKLPLESKSFAAYPEHPKSLQLKQVCPKSLHILIVDDEKVLLNTTSEMLRMLGHRVTTCQTGKEALEKYDKIWKSVDIVILDMLMPQMDGRQVYNSMKKINPSVNVLIASGFVEDDLYDDLLNRGIKGVIRKPFHLENLSDKIIEIYQAR